MMSLVCLALLTVQVVLCGGTLGFLEPPALLQPFFSPPAPSALQQSLPAASRDLVYRGSLYNPAAPPPPLLLAALHQQQPSQGKAKRVVPTPASQPANEVVWGTCFPRNALVRRGQDARLSCQAAVRPGTRFTWYKNNQLIQRPGVASESSVGNVQENLEELTNMVSVAASNTSSRHLLDSTLYLDCVTDQVAGDYSLEARIGTNVQWRNVTVFVTDMSQRAPSCDISPQTLAFLPRIYQFSRRVEVVGGASVTLPCRAQGHRIAHTWYSNNTPVNTQNSNYQVQANGDLVIVRAQHQGNVIYECRVTSTLDSRLQDVAITLLTPQASST